MGGLLQVTEYLQSNTFSGAGFHTGVACRAFLIINHSKVSFHADSIMLTAFFAQLAANTTRIAIRPHYPGAVPGITSHSNAIFIWRYIDYILWAGSDTNGATGAFFIVDNGYSVNYSYCVKYTCLIAVAASQTAIAAGFWPPTSLLDLRATVIKTFIVIEGFAPGIASDAFYVSCHSDELRGG